MKMEIIKTEGEDGRRIFTVEVDDMIPENIQKLLDNIRNEVLMKKDIIEGEDNGQ
jgi:hypothetical protein